jgi:hypothetical protein
LSFLAIAIAIRREKLSPVRWTTLLDSFASLLYEGFDITKAEQTVSGFGTNAR